jgi:hypothetical protein
MKNILPSRIVPSLATDSYTITGRLAGSFALMTKSGTLHASISANYFSQL